MASHFEDIGFNIKDKNEYLNLLNYMIAHSIKHEIIEGIYYAYSPPDTRISIWIHFKNDKPVDIYPFFEGDTITRVRVSKKFLSKEGTTRVHCWIDPDEKGEGGFPIIFDAPGYWKIESNIIETLIYNIKLTAFVDYVEIYNDEKDFETNAPKNIEARKKSEESEDKANAVRGYAPDYFIPIGTFSPVLNKPDPAESTAVFASKIKKVNIVKNSYSNTKFYWIVVKTLFGELDIVCASSAFKKRPAIGNILDGHFYISGKFIF